MSGAVADKARIATGPVTAIPPEALESLAARFRSGGLFLITLNCDGSVAYHDSAAGVFFRRYALPILQWRESAEADFQQHFNVVTASSGVVVWRFIPGVLIA